MLQPLRLSQNSRGYLKLLQSNLEETTNLMKKVEILKENKEEIQCLEQIYNKGGDPFYFTFIRRQRRKITFIH